MPACMPTSAYTCQLPHCPPPPPPQLLQLLVSCWKDPGSAASLLPASPPHPATSTRSGGTGSLAALFLNAQEKDCGANGTVGEEEVCPRKDQQMQTASQGISRQVQVVRQLLLILKPLLMGGPLQSPCQSGVIEVSQSSKLQPKHLLSLVNIEGQAPGIRAPVCNPETCIPKSRSAYVLPHPHPI